MTFDPAQVEKEIHEWFFVEYFDRWVARGAGESDEDPSFIGNYWNAPMFVCAPPLTKIWLKTEEHVLLFFQAQQEQLKVHGYTHTDIPSKRITVFTEDGGSIEVIWSRCAGDREVERLVVHFQVAKLEDRWKVVGIHSKYTDQDTVEDAWAAPAGRGPISPSSEGQLDINRLDPQLAPVFRQAPALPYHMPELLPAGRALYEFFTYSQPEDGVDVRSIEVGDTVVNTFAPHKGRHGGAFFWIHGGGLVSGQANQLSRGASAVAKMTGTTGITVNYRLAPEHPFPAAHDDCFAAWTWIQENAAELGIDPARVAILGSSAGGGLAASLVQRIHDEGGQQPACQVLFYPMLDDRTAADTDQDSGGHYVWSNASNRVAWNAFLSPQKAGDADLPNYAVAGRREDLSGLPPTWLGVGDVDLFYAEAKTYAERLEAAGVPVETHYAKGAPHVFEVMAPTADVSQAFLGSAFGYLGKSLAHKG